jgi:hypothetical protein
MTAPTVDQILEATSIGCGEHLWISEGGAIAVKTDELRPVLEQAYDPGMLNWTGLISIDDDGDWFVA